MVLKADKERIRTLLKDTITLLCKNGLSFKSKFSVEALIGVTLDEDDVFLVSINEIVKGDMVLPELDKSGDCSDTVASDSATSPQPNGKRRKRRKSKIKAEGNDGFGSDNESVDSNYSDFDQPDNEAAAFPSDDNEPVSKRAHLQVKQETQDDVDDDIVFVKSELESNWSQNDSTWGQHTPCDTNNQTKMYSGEGNMDMFQEDPNLPSTSFSGMDLVPVSQDTSGDWNSPTMNPKQNYRSHGPRSSTITASSSQDNTGSMTDPNSSQIMGLLSNTDGIITEDRANVTPTGVTETALTEAEGLSLGTSTQADAGAIGTVMKQEPLPDAGATATVTSMMQELLPDAGAAATTMQVDLSGSSLGGFLCSVCGKTFKRKDSMKRHQRFHSGSTFDCAVCGKSFNSKHNLRLHCDSKHLGLRHQCTECYKTFKTEQCLKIHLDEHKGKFKYLCKYCGRGFSYTMQYNAHVNKHEGKKPFLCKNCGSCFSSMSNKRAHEVQCVLTEKTEPCPTCHKTFKSAKYLRSHILNVHELHKSHLCMTCGKTFVHSGSLKKHITKCAKNS